jgi:plasmid stability protein
MGQALMDRKMMVRMSESQHKAVRVRAAELGRPVSEIVRELLTLWLDGRILLSLESEKEEETPKSD